VADARRRGSQVAANYMLDDLACTRNPTCDIFGRHVKPV
jgi:hypothetical protein